jgi:hypothetical protein
MPTKSWGPVTWIMLHTLSEKLNSNDVDFNNKFKEFKHLIHQLVSNLPCPLCTRHSINYFKKNNFNNVKHNELKKYLFDFHNDVNKNLGKQLFKHEDLDDTYKNNNIFQVMNHFISRYNASINGMFGFKQKQFIATFYEWFVNNKHMFNL